MIPPDARTVYGVFAATRLVHGDRPMLNVTPGTADAYGIPSGEITYARAAERVEFWTGVFAGAGIGEGMRVALLLENRPDFFLIWLALNCLGASAVPLNPDLRAAELEYLIGHAEPALIIAVPERLAELRAAAGPAVPAAAPGDSIPSPRAVAAAAPTDREFDREAAVLYTSGTTGKPKGCVLANSYFLEVGRWYSTLGGLVSMTGNGERMLTPLPVFHMNAMAYSFMAMIALGGCLTALDRFHPRRWWRDARDSGATCVHYLGVMPTILMGAGASTADRDHAVRFGFGAGVPPELHAPFEERFGFPLVEAWAMTETGAGAVISNHGADRVVGGSALGRAPENLDILLADETGAAAPEGGPGELLVRRKGRDPRLGFFSGYHKDPEATAEAWENGWFHTGDIARRGADGFYYFVDRRKNMIRRSGENIAAVEVESVLTRHPDISAAGVAPVADPVRGEEVFACLVVADPDARRAGDITAWALERMAYYKVPGHIAFVDRLPLTSTQKIQRAALKSLAAGLLGDPGTVDVTGMKKRSVP